MWAFKSSFESVTKPRYFTSSDFWNLMLQIWISIGGRIDSLVKCNIGCFAWRELEDVFLGEFFDNCYAVLELSLNNLPTWMAVAYLKMLHVKWCLKSAVIRQLTYNFVCLYYNNVGLTTFGGLLSSGSIWLRCWCTYLRCVRGCCTSHTSLLFHDIHCMPIFKTCLAAH